jgi:hypothetical protein
VNTFASSRFQAWAGNAIIQAGISHGLEPTHRALKAIGVFKVKIVIQNACQSATGISTVCCQWFSRVSRNKHQAVSQACGVLESAADSAICEHLQEPHNAGSQPQARFFNTLLIQSARLGLNDSTAKKGILFNKSVDIIPQCRVHALWT